MLRWLKPITWPLRSQFGWMIPKSSEQVRHEDFERRLYSSSLSFKERIDLEDEIRNLDPDFFTSEHFKNG